MEMLELLEELDAVSDRIHKATELKEEEKSWMLNSISTIASRVVVAAGDGARPASSTIFERIRRRWLPTSKELRRRR